MNMRFANQLSCLHHRDKQGRLDLSTYCVRDENEYVEGFLICELCHTKYPILEGIPILVKDFVRYASNRGNTYGNWLLQSKTPEMKTFLKNIASRFNPDLVSNDRYEEDGYWFAPYKWTQYDYSSEDHFLKLLKRDITPTDLYNNIIGQLPFMTEGIALDLGCSMGYTSLELSHKCSYVIGIDLSFSSIKEARRRMSLSNIRNLDFCVADSINLPFSAMRFDLILVLNLLELVEPCTLLSSIHRLLKPHAEAIFADPYDYKREPKPRTQLDGRTFRNLLCSSGFEILEKSKKTESYIPWILKIADRSYLFYFVDIVRARKISQHR